MNQEMKTAIEHVATTLEDHWQKRDQIDDAMRLRGSADVERLSEFFSQMQHAIGSITKRSTKSWHDDLVVDPERASASAVFYLEVLGFPPFSYEYKYDGREGAIRRAGGHTSDVEWVMRDLIVNIQQHFLKKS